MWSNNILGDKDLILNFFSAQRVLEQSRLEAEAEARKRKQEEDFLASIDFTNDTSNGNMQRLKVMGNCNSSNSQERRGVAGFSAMDNSDQEVSQSLKVIGKFNSSNIEEGMESLVIW